MQGRRLEALTASLERQTASLERVVERTGPRPMWLEEPEADPAE